MLSLSGPKAWVLLQLLIPLVTWSVVNVTAEVKDFRLMLMLMRHQENLGWHCPAILLDNLSLEYRN